MMTKEQKIVLPLIAIALAANAFLFAVTYTNASFSNSERALPQVFSPAQISSAFDQDLTIIADNLRWAVGTAVSQAKEPVLAFFGLDNYKFGQPRYTALAGQARMVSVLDWNESVQNVSGNYYAQAPGAGTPQVLGAHTQNYVYYAR